MAVLSFLLLASLAVASPLEFDLEKRQTCQGQSCVIANIAGSSGQPIDVSRPPVGDTAKGDCCVVSYKPALAPLAIQFRPELVNTCPELFKGVKPSNDTLIIKRGAAIQDAENELLAAMYARDLLASLPIEAEEEVTEPILEKRACKSKILIFAKGTFEPGPLGVTLGPRLSRSLGATWDVRGVDYDPSLAGDYCLGLPGGVIATETIKSTVAQCPNSLIAIGGYSQGAMVARNGLASLNNNQAVQSKIKGVLTFGDPFNGSPIKGYKGPIKTFCAAGDGVCSGNFQISAAHLSYGSSSAGGVTFLNSL